MLNKITGIIIWFSFFSFASLNSFAEGNNNSKFSTSFHYLQDLSDTFKGGTLLNLEVGVSRKWYGLRCSFGFFQCQSTFIHQVIPEEPINLVIDIPIEELAVMKTLSVSSYLIPVQSKILELDIQLGICYNNSKRLIYKDIYYTYDLNLQKLTSLVKEYMMLKGTRLGYQVGFDVSFFLTKKFGLDISSRIQSLHKGGSFFFVGGGICFKI
jgi:hypothetical protein